MEGGTRQPGSGGDSRLRADDACSPFMHQAPPPLTRQGLLRLTLGVCWVQWKGASHMQPWCQLQCSPVLPDPLPGWGGPFLGDLFRALSFLGRNTSLMVGRLFSASSRVSASGEHWAMWGYRAGPVTAVTARGLLDPPLAL